MKNRPSKPTHPYGYISFAKDGKASKHISQLSPEKEKQESGAIERFIEGYNRILGCITIHKFKQLPEDDQDFLLNTSGGTVTVQLTELVERDFTKQISAEEYHQRKYHHFIQKGLGAIPWAVDRDMMNASLKRRIQKKLSKNYVKSPAEVLWLIIFSTSSMTLTEYYECGQVKISEPLLNARTYLQAVSNCIFDEIWFTNFLTRPVRIWPF